MADYLKRIVARSAGDRAPAVLAPRPRLMPETDDPRPPEPVLAPSSPTGPLQVVPAPTPHARPSASHDVTGPVTLQVAPVAVPHEPPQRADVAPRQPATVTDPAEHVAGTREESPAREIEPNDAADPLAAMDREIRRLLRAAQRADAEPVEEPSERDPAEAHSFVRAERRERPTALPRLEPPVPSERTPPRPEARRLVIGRVLVEVAPPAPAAPSPAPEPRPAAAPRPFRAGELRGVAFRRSFGMGQS